MNFASINNGALLRIVKPIFASSGGIFSQQSRNTYIVRRKYPLNAHKKDAKPKINKSRYFVYETVENTNCRPLKPIDLILTSYVPGVGVVGERLQIKAEQAYTKLLLPGLAVYASPENVEQYKDLIEEAKSKIPDYSSIWVGRTMNVLSTLLLSVVVSKNSPWTLQKYHVRAAFRKINIHVPDHAITLPEREISGPNTEIQNKEFYIVVTINKRETVKVRCRLHHIAFEEKEKYPFCEFWKTRESAIFPEDQPILDSMPPHRLWVEENDAANV